MSVSGETSSPSLRARWLGEQMRGLREERGLTLKYVARQLDVDFAVVARHERGGYVLDRDRAAGLLDVYEVHGRERERLLQLAQDAWRLPRWEADFDAPIRDPSFMDLLWLESRAQAVRCYSTTLVPTLLQTIGYGQAVTGWAEGPEPAAARVQRWMGLCRDRQQILTADPPTGLCAVLDESVLHRPVGRPGVWRGQLDHLAEVGDRRHVELRVLPTQAGYQPGADGSFVVFDLPAPCPPVACVEHLAGRLFLEAGQAGPFTDAFERLRAAALGPGESAALIAALAGQASDTG